MLSSGRALPDTEEVISSNLITPGHLRSARSEQFTCFFLYGYKIVISWLLLLKELKRVKLLIQHVLQNCFFSFSREDRLCSLLVSKLVILR